MRYVRASMSVGPSPRAPRSMALRTVWTTANTSLPSTLTAGTPYATPFAANVSDAVCRSAGTLIAHPLLRQKKTTGTLKTPAKLSPEWKSEELVAPSPKYTRVARSSFRSLPAHANPTACVICVPTGELIDSQCDALHV